MRRFVIIGGRASARGDFLLSDIPGTSGRLDVLLRCVRAALLVSHGVRRDVVVYLALLGDPAAPRALRIDGASARYLRPDERTLATLVKKALASPHHGPSFADVRPGVAVADGGLDVIVADLGPGDRIVLDEGGEELRACPLDVDDGVFFVGDSIGLDDAVRDAIDTLGARSVNVGPVSIHAEDAIAIVTNECDRRLDARSKA